MRLLQRFCLVVLILNCLFANLALSREDYSDTPKENDYPYTEEDFSPCGIKKTDQDLNDAHQPEVAEQPEITYVTGGICQDEAQFMKGIAPKFPLAIMVLEKADARTVYLADVRVTLINQHKETVLDVMTEGPFLLVNCPPGQYQVHALFHGIEKKQNIKIQSNQHHKIHFIWDLGADTNAAN